MTAMTKFYSFNEALAEKVHNLGSDSLKVALCAAANPPLVTNTVLANLTEISYTNLSSRAVTTTTSAQTLGVYKLVLAPLVLTASVGDVAAFRYGVLYNDTASNKELIGFYDYLADIILHGAAAETFTFVFDGTAGVLTLT